MTGIREIDKSLQKTAEWINFFAGIVGTSDKEFVFKCLKAVLVTLRDRLTPEEATDLAAQLPMVLRGMYFNGWNPTGKPDKMDRAEFLTRVHSFFNHAEDVEPDLVVKAVLEGLRQKIKGGEFDDVRNNMPKDIRDMFPAQLCA